MTDLYQIADLLEETLVIRSRTAATMSTMGLPRFYAFFDFAEEKDDGILRSAAGNGATPHEALVAYARRIAGKLMAFHAGDARRREFRMPHDLGVQTSRWGPG